MNYKIISVILLIIIITLSVYLITTSINQQHEKDISDAFFSGRVNVLSSISEQLQKQNGQVVVSVPVNYTDIENTEWVNVLLVLEVNEE